MEKMEHEINWVLVHVKSSKYKDLNPLPTTRNFWEEAFSPMDISLDSTLYFLLSMTFGSLGKWLFCTTSYTIQW